VALVLFLLAYVHSEIEGLGGAMVVACAPPVDEDERPDRGEGGRPSGEDMCRCCSLVQAARRLAIRGVDYEGSEGER